MINRELIKKLKEKNDKDMNKEKKPEKFIFIIELNGAWPERQMFRFYSEMTLVELDQKMVAMMTCAMVWFKVFYHHDTKERSDLWVNPSSIRTIRYSKEKDHKRN